VVVGKDKWQKQKVWGNENFSRLKASGILFLFEGKDMTGNIYIFFINGKVNDLVFIDGMKGWQNEWREGWLWYLVGRTRIL
jgi:hypothetical protein